MSRSYYKMQRSLTFHKLFLFFFRKQSCRIYLRQLDIQLAVHTCCAHVHVGCRNKFGMTWRFLKVISHILCILPLHILIT
jgi:hypothetical protein